MSKVKITILFLVGAFLCLPVGTGAAYAQTKPTAEQVKHGHYLVATHACGDCHTPWKMAANGPEQDSTRLLSGHPQQLAMPPAPLAQGPWMASVSATFTAWAGPWGVSFSKNLTPDKETGLGNWTEENFVSTFHTGREMGKGRMILPPMPIPSFSQMTDEELKDIFAYLQTIPAIKNKVPDPIAPPPAPAGGK
jgi:mono/diheme cytochrome c family protein